MPFNPGPVHHVQPKMPFIIFFKKVIILVSRKKLGQCYLMKPILQCET
jgi:hypothetical protein